MTLDMPYQSIEGETESFLTHFRNSILFRYFPRLDEFMKDLVLAFILFSVVSTHVFALQKTTGTFRVRH
jgi:hypothetical protein